MEGSEPRVCMCDANAKLERGRTWRNGGVQEGRQRKGYGEDRGGYETGEDGEGGAREV